MQPKLSSVMELALHFSVSPQEERLKKLKVFVQNAPLLPGVYIMKSEKEEIIYIGKAKALKKRLASYFNSQNDIKTSHLLGKLHSISWIITSSEFDALLLENTMIKEHKPKYNLDLKDGKTYASIRVTKETFPRVIKTRRIIADGSTYFGPFPRSESIDVYLDAILKLYPLRRCKIMRKRSSPCMYYHIGRCSAPCAEKISKEEYAKKIESIKKILSGGTETILADLRSQMDAAACNLKFELAGQLRDSISAIGQFAGNSSAVDLDPKSKDYICWATNATHICFVVLQVRNGRLQGSDQFSSVLHSSEEDAIQTFFTNYYSANRLPPQHIFIPKSSNYGIISLFFRKVLGCTTKITKASTAPQIARMNLALQNAKEYLLRLTKEGGNQLAMIELRDVLQLQNLPERIEGFDISHWAGKHTLASLVCFKNGLSDKKNYRYFKIKSLNGAGTGNKNQHVIDDYASMREALGRRYTRLLNEGEVLPDLILVDGGKGQVSAAKDILDSLQVHIPVIALAKKHEEIFTPDCKVPLRLPRPSAGLTLLVKVRDEAHRFATSLNKRLRTKELKFGELMNVKGIGEKRALKLMRGIGSLNKIANASLEEICKVGGISFQLATELKAGLNRGGNYK